MAQSQSRGFHRRRQKWSDRQRRAQQNTTTSNAPTTTEPSPATKARTERRKEQQAKHRKKLLNAFSRLMVQIVTFPVKVVKFLTEPPGSAISTGIGAFYFMMLSAEGYWQAMSAGNPAFLPKPFANDGADLGVFFTTALWDWGFWIAVVLSLIIQSVQAKVMRETKDAIDKAKAEYEAVKHYTVDEDVPEGAIAIVNIKRSQYENAGMRSMRTRGALILITYLIDIGTAFWNFPLFGVRLVQTAVNAIWIFASVFGAETMMAWFQDALEEDKNRARTTEVV